MASKGSLLSSLSLEKRVGLPGCVWVYVIYMEVESRNPRIRHNLCAGMKRSLPL